MLRGFSQSFETTTGEEASLFADVAKGVVRLTVISAAGNDVATLHLAAYEAGILGDMLDKAAWILTSSPPAERTSDVPL